MSASSGGRALVAGGGIGGLAAASALAHAGWQVTLAERRPAFAAESAENAAGSGIPSAGLPTVTLGAGIQISPNASRCLAAIGALEEVAAMSFRPGAAVLREGRTGRVVYRAALGDAAEARWGAPYLHVHRADLVAALANAACRAGVSMRAGHTVADVAEGSTIRARVEIDRAHSETVEADLLVIADGLGSRLRAALFGEAPRRFTGQTAWRAVLPAEVLPAAGRMAPDATVWAAPGRHLVTYYLRGGTLLNLVAVEEASRWEGESWSAEGDPARLRSAFDDMHPSVRALLGAVEAPRLWGLFERPMPRRWHTGRAVLLGDAVHAMLPFMAQGAAMALEDAVVLARTVGAPAGVSPDLAPALEAYEATRRPRVERVMRTSRDNGALFHRGPGFRRLFDHALIGTVSRLAPGLAAGRLDWLYGFDATAKGTGNGYGSTARAGRRP
ncbi:MAG: FAD-dependent oxidoreductase [Pseudomonadota bacterium]